MDWKRSMKRAHRLFQILFVVADFLMAILIGGCVIPIILILRSLAVFVTGFEKERNILFLSGKSTVEDCYRKFGGLDLLVEDRCLILGTPNEGCFLAWLQNNLLEPPIKRTTDHILFYTEKGMREKIQQTKFVIQDIMHDDFFFPLPE